MLNIVSIWLFFLEKYDIGYKETIALCGTRCVIIDIQAPSFTRVNSCAFSLNALRKPHSATVSSSRRRLDE